MANSVGDDVKEELSRPYRKAYDFATKALGVADKPVIPKKVDQSYSRDMLKRANDSFKVSNSEVKPKTKLAQKPPVRKRAAAKR
jgi:hypothetical protein